MSGHADQQGMEGVHLSDGGAKALSPTDFIVLPMFVAESSVARTGPIDDDMPMLINDDDSDSDYDCDSVCEENSGDDIALPAMDVQGLSDHHLLLDS
jgi:hypothetical protein